MRRAARYFFELLCVLSLLLFVAVCVLWVRSRTAADYAYWTYDRHLPDGGAAGTNLYLTSDARRLFLSSHHGLMDAYRGNVRYGYQVNADQTGGRPQFMVGRRPSAAVDPLLDASGGGPLRWQMLRANDPAPPRVRGWLIRIGVSHWMAAMMLLVAPALWLNAGLKARRVRRLGLCTNCGYDLRASPDRCPECGAVPETLERKRLPLRHRTASVTA